MSERLHREINERLNAVRDTGDLYATLVASQDVPNPRWCGIGMNMLPSDPTSLAIAHALGSEGTLFHADPIGQESNTSAPFTPSNIFTHGGALELEKQLDILRPGMNLATYAWLGAESHYGNIPLPDESLHGIADHYGLEFFYGQDNRSQKNGPYLVDGVIHQLSKLAVGGLYVYQGRYSMTLREVFGKPFTQWLTEQGCITVSMYLETDEAHIPIDAGESLRIKTSFLPACLDLAPFIDETNEMFHAVATTPTANGVWYPSTYVIIAQKIQSTENKRFNL